MNCNRWTDTHRREDTIGNRLFTAISHDAALYGTKKSTQDCILFYRLGILQEMFFIVPCESIKELEITLTGKECSLKRTCAYVRRTFHTVDSYLYTFQKQRAIKLLLQSRWKIPKLAKDW